MKTSRIDGHSGCDTHGWCIEKTKSGDDKLKCPECAGLLIIDHIDHSTSSPAKCMICGGCGNEYIVTKYPIHAGVEDRKIRASRELGEKLKNLHVGTEVSANIALNCRVRRFNDLGNKVSIEFPIKMLDGSIIYGSVDEWVSINSIEIIESETSK